MENINYQPEEFDEGFLQILVEYTKAYQNNGKSFIGAYLKFPSIRSACYWIVAVCKQKGIYNDAKQTGKNFTDYVSKFALTDQEKQTMADTLLIIYSIINE